MQDEALSCMDVEAPLLDGPNFGSTGKAVLSDHFRSPACLELELPATHMGPPLLGTLCGTRPENDYFPWPLVVGCW